MDRDSPFIAKGQRSSPIKSSPSKYLASSPLKMQSPLKTPLRTLTPNDANIRANTPTPNKIEYTVHSLKKRMQAIISPQKSATQATGDLKQKKRTIPTMEEVLSRSKSMTGISSSMGPPVAEFHIPELYTSLHRSSSDPPHPLTPEQAAAARMLTQRRQMERLARDTERNNLSSDATIPTDDGALEESGIDFIDSDGNELSPRLRKFVDAITSGSSSSEDDEAGHVSKKVKRKGSPFDASKNRTRSNSGASDDDPFPQKRSRSITPIGDNPVKKRRQTKKPDHPTYRAMIGIVLSYAPLPFCLNDIYEKVLEYWPTLRGEDLKRGDSGWKNSIRHNLSLNPEYIHKARPADLPGKGDIWQMLDEWKDGHQKAADEWLDKMKARGAEYVKDVEGLRITRHPDLECEDEEEALPRKRPHLDDQNDPKRRASTGSAVERKPKRRNIKHSKSTSNLQKGKDAEVPRAAAIEAAANPSKPLSNVQDNVVNLSTIVPPTNIFASTEDYNASTANVYLTSSPMRGYMYPPTSQRKEHSLLSSSPMPEVKYFAQDSLIMTPPRVPAFSKGSPTPNTRTRQIERTVYGPVDYGVSPGKAEAIEQDRQLLAQMYEGADAFYSYNSSLDPSQFRLTSAGPGPSPLGKKSVSAHDLEEEAAKDAGKWKAFFNWERNRVAESGNSRTIKNDPW